MNDSKHNDGGARIAPAFALTVLGAAGLTALIALTSPFLSRFYPLLPDSGASWYFWQLPEPTMITRLSAWLPYLAHQIALWILAYRFSKEQAHPDRLSRLNVAALIINACFVLLHIAQTQLFYDGLAQDVPVWTSQGSVIVMLVLMIYMAAPRRGFALGIKPRYGERALAWVRSWHGYYISWALCYTFWFHPTEGDYGLLTGFFYMFLLFAQFSFANTKLHWNLAWIATLELLVGLHGPAIAIQKALSGNEGDIAGPGIWIMFASGFLFMFAFTGQYGLKMNKAARVVVFAAYAALVGSLYAWRGFGKLYEISFIPTALYGGAIALSALAWLWAKVFPRQSGAATTASPR